LAFVREAQSARHRHCQLRSPVCRLSEVSGASGRERRERNAAKNDLDLDQPP
jgi:hypothetical protein